MVNRQGLSQRWHRAHIGNRPTSRTYHVVAKRITHSHHKDLHRYAITDVPLTPDQRNDVYLAHDIALDAGIVVARR